MGKQKRAIQWVFLIVSIYFTCWQLSRHTRNNSVCTTDDCERYLSYLPHSGLSNQRIELANALLLAGMLGRTLIVPPALLGEVLGWKQQADLVKQLRWLTTPKNFTEICGPQTPSKLESYVVRSQCENYHHFGTLDWTDLHDLEPLAPYVKIRFHPIVSSLEELRRDLHLNKDDVFEHVDSQLYDWRLYEDVDEAHRLASEQLNYFDSFSGRKYYKVFTPQHWQQRRERLLYLGGMFGSTRLSVTTPKNVALQDHIAKALRYRLDTPLGDAVLGIVDYLGGRGGFESVHLRTGDRPFRENLTSNLDYFGREMTTLFGSDDCTNKRIYMATDHRNPRSDSSPLRRWFNQFPCTTILNDLPPRLLESLALVHDRVAPEKSLRPFLIPLVDAMVAAHGKHILTTPRSTYSRYIGELNEAWMGPIAKD